MTRLIACVGFVSVALALGCASADSYDYDEEDVLAAQQEVVAYGTTTDPNAPKPPDPKPNPTPGCLSCPLQIESMKLERVYPVDHGIDGQRVQPGGAIVETEVGH